MKKGLKVLLGCLVAFAAWAADPEKKDAPKKKSSLALRSQKALRKKPKKTPKPPSSKKTRNSPPASVEYPNDAIRSDFPHISEIEEEALPEPNSKSFAGNMKDLSIDISRSVRLVAKRWNWNCFGESCLIQAIPLAYTRKNSGFFGGLRSKITNISEKDPYAYSIDFSYVRSDTRQFSTWIGFDFPDLEFLPLDPRFKLRFFYSDTTQSRYYGEGEFSKDATDLDQEDVRYQLADMGFNTALIVPVGQIFAARTGVFLSFSSVRKDAEPYEDSDTLLFQQKPRGYEGGISSSLGIGFVLDTRDREVDSREGLMFEVSAAKSGDPLGRFDFNRTTLVDRRYFSSGRWTLAHRLTLDGVWGDVPFWELAAVGGIDPILDISNSSILRGYRNGRYHENYKGIESLEVRVHHRSFRAWGQYCEPTLLPIGGDFAYFGKQFAWSATSGMHLLWNRSFMMRFYMARSLMGWSLNLKFGQDF